MGMNIMSSCNSYNTNSINPNPNNFSYIDIMDHGNYTMVKVRYHDCTNYEGIKILVFKHCSKYKLLNMNSIDPHFNEDSCLIARFEPTDDGWKMAKFFIEILVLQDSFKKKI